ncbi:YbdK family carboxylate-amine ligase [Thermoleophilia bacterium SCSIO 60948]|nr:YbdK family carboxylate-amine ligase [Thermoleophilia bacterium SCSIO 60948]
MPDHLRDPGFGSEHPFAIGVEEELFLADPSDGRLLNARERVLDSIADPARGEITGEVHACEIELISGVCRTAGEAVAELSELRRIVLDSGVGLIGSGTHPSADEQRAEVSDRERYRFISEQLGDALVTPVAATHVHIGMPDAETAIRVFNGLRRHLPVLEALAANAPFRHGRDTGFASARELALRAWARSGTPRPMDDYEDFVAYAERLNRAAGIEDYTFHWWKLRPHPALGTVELRALDAQATPAHTASISALVHALARHEADADPIPGPAPEILEESSYRGARAGLDAELPDADGRLTPARDVLAATLELAADAAAELGCTGELGAIEDLVAVGGGAGLQERDAERGGIDAVLEGLLERAKPT